MEVNSTGSGQPDLTLSIISSDNLELLNSCLDSIYNNTQRIRLEIFVVDNASIDGTAETIALAFPKVNIFRNKSRLGFSTNNNKVLSQGKGRYLMLLNDDTRILDGALDRLVKFMDERPDVSAIGAYLLNPDNSPQPAYAHFPHPILEAIWPASNWSYLLAKKPHAPIEVDSVCGAAMLVRRDVLNTVGLLDTDFDPIYSEEVDWCYRIKEVGGRVYLHPGARIIHHGSITMDRTRPRKYELLLSHKYLYFKKNSGPKQAKLYKVTLLVVSMLKWLYWSLSSLIRPADQPSHEKRELQRFLLNRIPFFD